MAWFRRIFLLAAILAATIATPAAAQAAGLTATFSKSSDWGTGYVADYTIHNGGGSIVNGWQLEFNLPTGTTFVNAWNGDATTSGNHVVITNASWNQTLAPAASADVGFQTSYTGTFVAPQNCLLNGQSCAGGPADTQPPSAPTGLTATGETATTIALKWNPSTDNVGVAGYRVFSGSTQVATTTATTATVTGLNPSTKYTFTAYAFDGAGNVSKVQQLGDRLDHRRRRRRERRLGHAARVRAVRRHDAVPAVLAPTSRADRGHQALHARIHRFGRRLQGGVGRRHAAERPVDHQLDLGTQGGRR